MDLKGILALGPKALIMFLTGTAGIVLGGPLALLLFSVVSPETVGGAGPDAVWRGLTTVAGSWIGGSANQAAMKEVFAVSDEMFSAMVAVDILVANVWMGVLLYLASRAPGIDRNSGRGASQWTANVRLNKSIGLGGVRSGPPNMPLPPPPTGGAMAQRVGGGGPGGDGGPQMMVMEGANTRYRLDLYVNVQNAFNHTNYNAFIGNQLSPFFGTPTSAGPARRVEIGASVSF